MKDFIKLQPRRWQAIYKLYFEEGLTPEERRIKVKNYLLEAGFSDGNAEKIANVLIGTFTANVPFIETESDEDKTEAILSLQDIHLLKEKLVHEPDPFIRRLLISCLVYARVNPHPSFWIKYDRKVITFLAGVDKLKSSEIIILTNKLHNLYNLNMQVVGSTQPITCFQVAWQADQPPVNSEENPEVLLGPLNPATIRTFEETIPYVRQVHKEQAE